jgi:DeoR family glycerol-3-phosphate regulon repressor
MDLTARQQDILTAARNEGRVGVDALARTFDVTPQTIRRDLNDLCQRGLLSRVHGGAMPANSVSNVDYEERRNLASAEKRLIGIAAADLIPENSSVMLNLGTTTEQVARGLTGHSGLVVITNNINVINILNGTPGKELILAGGVVRQADGGIVGEAAVEFIRQFKADIAVIGASAIDDDGAILDYDQREVSVARAILDSARRVILVADHLKFERTAPMRICGLDRVDMFVTDKAPPAAFMRACKTHGVTVEIVGQDPFREPLNEHGSPHRKRTPEQETAHV